MTIARAIIGRRPARSLMRPPSQKPSTPKTAEARIRAVKSAVPAVVGLGELGGVEEAAGLHQAEGGDHGDDPPQAPPVGRLDPRPERRLHPVLGARDEEGARLGQAPAQVGGEAERRERDEVEEPPVERRERDEQQQPGDRPVAQPRDDAERREPGAAPVGPQLLGDDEVRQARLGRQEDARDHLQDDEGQEAPGERGHPGRQGEERERGDQQRAPAPAVGEAHQRQAAQRGEPDDGDADAEGGDRDAEALRRSRARRGSAGRRRRPRRSRRSTSGPRTVHSRLLKSTRDLMSPRLRLDAALIGNGARDLRRRARRGRPDGHDSSASAGARRAAWREAIGGPASGAC